ncbi:MAG TPA: hypothetical protein VFM70_04410 [Salinimicrobium sp.]|nr:hypothetical protein [Salinimicrobium sp.]
MAKDKFNFKTDLHLIASNDDLRPAMSLIYFKNDYCYATDAHVLIKQHISHHGIINPEHLNGKALHMRVFQLIKQKFNYAVATEEGIECKDEFHNKVLFNYAEMDQPEFVDRMEDVIPKGEAVEVGEIGINLSMLNRLRKAMIINNTGCKFKFHGINKCIVVSANGEDKQLGILMPVML